MQDSNSPNLAGLAGLTSSTLPGNSIPGLPTTSPLNQPGTNPYNLPPPTMSSALDVAKGLGHISEQQLLQNSLTSIVNTIEQTRLRPLQRESFVCSAKCCDDPNATKQTFQHCLQNCNLGVQRANQSVQHELQRFQQRIQRQAQECQESARDMQMGGANDTDTQTHYTECTEGVFARSRGMLPELRSRLGALTVMKT
jgi:hypothetical protein